MTLDQRKRERLLVHCGQIRDGDGVDPREFFHQSRFGRKEDRKAKQLCRQVAETLDMVLSGECHDELLQSLHVFSVEPAPNASRLLVTLCADVEEDRFDRPAILGLLNDQAGRLRYEVARTIHRKRVPTLVFHVVGPEGSLS
ncbi:MAG: ribosome-binding factor A [Candidatus Nealsonbacteria bacterium]|nr:ribosome-binding factor A [Candidatus Nealsonbacteria bacterium]